MWSTFKRLNKTEQNASVSFTCSPFINQPMSTYVWSLVIHNQILGSNTDDLIFFDIVCENFQPLVSDGDQETAEVGKLLQSYSTGSPKFSELNKEVLAKAGINVAKVEEKLSLLDCISYFSTAALPHTFSFEDIATSLCCSPEAVPEKLYKLNDVCTFSVDFVHRRADVVAAPPRAFARTQWENLRTKLTELKEKL